MSDELEGASTERRRAARGRLAGKVVLLTGAAGNIGTQISRLVLREGATLVMTGRDQSRLDAARAALREELRVPLARIVTVAADGAEPGQVRLAVEQVIAKVGRIDVLVNNAGSAGPKCRLRDIPFTTSELEALAEVGIVEKETVGAAARSLFGIAWNFVRAVAPHLDAGSSIINVSTIFSRTQYYGRAAYVVPKAALNAFSRQLAAELGGRGVRVNTVFPGPIRSERIRTVFSAMDKLRHVDDGTTASENFELMSLARSVDGAPPERTFPTVQDVANTIVFLASDESAAYNGHNFEVTHGMRVRQESRSTFVSRPELRTVDGTGVRVLLAAGDQVKDALTVARVQAACNAEVLLGLGSEEGVRAAQEALGAELADQRIRPVLLDRMRPDTVHALFESLRRDGGGGARCDHHARVRRLALSWPLHRGERQRRHHIHRW
jgi:malonyl-CoA reductase / 3-hydroxypropionate dehydrogenase (NADP+)